MGDASHPPGCRSGLSLGPSRAGSGHIISIVSAPKVIVLHGDQTGEELLLQALRLFEPGLLGLGIEMRDFDLSLEQRRKTRNQVVTDAADALRDSGFGIKAATITPEGAGDVGSPNAILRKQIDGRVIVRTGRRIPGVRQSRIAARQNRPASHQPPPRTTRSAPSAGPFGSFKGLVP